jgi:hypothetical protein
MKTIYQTVKMNEVFEVLEDQKNGLFLFKNGKYFSAPKSLEESKLFIDSFAAKQKNMGVIPLYS